MIRRKTGYANRDLLKYVPAVITTKGAGGSQILTTALTYEIPAVKARKAVDPTGAGDAYRAGIIKGLLNGWDWERTGRVAALAAVYAVEKYGTQEHGYTFREFQKRYQRNFGKFASSAL